MDVNKLRQLCQSRGWSEPMFARILGIDYSYLYRVMRGERKAGKKFISSMLRLCRHLNLDIYDFLNEEELKK